MQGHHHLARGFKRIQLSRQHVACLQKKALLHDHDKLSALLFWLLNECPTSGLEKLVQKSTSSSAGHILLVIDTVLYVLGPWKSAESVLYQISDSCKSELCLIDVYSGYSHNDQGNCSHKILSTKRWSETEFSNLSHWAIQYVCLFQPIMDV